MDPNRIANLKAQINANATKAQQILASDDFDPAEAQKLLADNDILIERVKALESFAGKSADLLPYGNRHEESHKSAEQMEREDAVKAARAGLYTSGHNVFDGATRAEKQLKAYKFGMWFLATTGNRKAIDWCAERGIKAQVERDNDLGGFLVPDEFVPDVIVLREQYGVFRQRARVVPMSSDTRIQPKHSGGLTAYFVGEGQSITSSDASWGNVKLTAKKLATYTKMSSELNEDAAIEIGGYVAREIAYAFANKEDECGFNGDGTSTYGGIVGVREALKGLSTTIANISGLQVGTGNLYSELVLSDFRAVIGLLPQYADTPSAAWFCHRTFYHNVMAKLADAAAGNTNDTLARGTGPMFLGYPVVFSQVMPKSEANSQVCALLGDLSQAAMLGDRRGIGIMLSEHDAFQTDELALRGTTRFDINVHDVGNATATAADKRAGAVVGLITAAS